MIAAPMPENEDLRMQALRRLGVLDTPSEPIFDDLVRLASIICGTPIALVSLIDTHRQWFKARMGVDADETPRELSFCGHAILGNDVFEISDATQDERFFDNPFVTEEPKVRFYAGVPLSTLDGHNLGTLCVLDLKTRRLTSEQLDGLRMLARQTMAQLERHQQLMAIQDQESRFQAFMNSSSMVAFMKDDVGRMVYVNQPLAKKFNIPASEWISKTDEEMFPEEYALSWRENDLRVLQTGLSEELLETSPNPDGGASTWMMHKFRLEDAQGKRYLGGIGVDVSEKMEIERALRSSESKFRTVVNRLNDGVFFVEPDTLRIVETNIAFQHMIGYLADELLTMNKQDLFLSESRTDNSALVTSNLKTAMTMIRNDGSCFLGGNKFRKKNGDSIHVEARATLIEDSGRELFCFVVRDTTAQLAYEDQLFQYQVNLEDANRQLKSLATTDGLTGVRNRAAFNDRFMEEFDRATRFQRPLSLIMLDVDHFKLYNDAFGHPAGDDVLKDVAGLLQDTARSSDVVARYGGEEFALILPDTDYNGAMVMAERCRREVANGPWSKRVITASIGVSTLCGETANIADMIANADAALYRSKSAGRNRVQHGSGKLQNLMRQTENVTN
jgi:diguanylate cyclase (GGDEF)-like protein/PAS domain S-box-containing protein